MSLIGPHGMDAASRAASQAAAPRSRKRPARIGRSSAPPHDPVAVRREAGIHSQLRHSEDLAEPRPLALRSDGHGDRAVRGVERLVRDDVGMRVAEPLRRRARDEGVLRLVDQAGQRGAEQRDVDALAAARARGRLAVPLATDEGGENADRAEHPGHDVADRHAHLGRSAAFGVRGAGDRHQATRRLDDEVVAGQGGRRTGRTEAGDRQVDERRVQALQPSSSKPEAREAADPEVLDDDVAASEQPAQDLPAPSGVLRSSRRLRLFRLTAR